jgi:starch synthase (maltosyl-transferring)
VIPIGGSQAVVVENLEPIVDCGRFAAKAVVGDPVIVEADVFAHGHDLVRAWLRHRAAGGRGWKATAMTSLGNDRWRGSFVPGGAGTVEIEVVGAMDELATWQRDATRRLAADRLDSFDHKLGAGLLTEAAGELRSGGEDEAANTVAAQASEVEDGIDAGVLDQVEALTEVLLLRPPPAAGTGTVTIARTTVKVARERAAFSSWYELFPRSASPEPGRAGTLADVVGRLDYVAALGFDVLYLPPIHPIGTTARKGRGNSPLAGPGDVGSPWAIGSAEGGHDAIAKELGSIADFERLVGEAAARGIEIALDLAFQCSPDHPWVGEHPAWFAHRLDGTIACAENPPKRYEDIYPLDFSTEDREGLWQALLGVVRVWVERGVHLFRVDNPHTKPFEFWEWLIDAVKAEHPEVLFLSEAFTRPKVMHRLAKLGFDQSYTYFTWRDTKQELMDYFDELAHGPGRCYFRPNVWPNTPDILARSLAEGGPPAFVTRLVLAAGLSANYGIYGPVFELLEREPAAPGSEEYLASEKYEVRHHDLADPRSIAGVVARVNEARRAHPALQRDRHLRFHHIDNDRIICWSKRDDTGGDTVIGVVNLDPTWAQAGVVDLDLAAIGLAPDVPFVVQDMLDGATYTWVGPRNYVQLDPARRPAHLFSVAQAR